MAMRIAELRKSECCPVIGQIEVALRFWDNITGSDQFRVVSPSPCKVFGQSANPRGLLDLRVNTVRKVDVAQWVDELAFLYTNIRLRHQRNKTTVGRIVPSHLLDKLQRWHAW